MAKDYNAKTKWKRDVNYIADLVSDINQKMDHIVKEMRAASHDLGHLVDGYSRKSKQRDESRHQDYAFDNSC
ncbi:MAG: hypothetical protein UY62_C0012G0003 [Parcubacteria group bacterium GW2011_GWF2_50_9]|nr:MAG: hypothetical protein UY62_C0012G0003 [Parcubacteria group bacterium GW2011_GWF2_50_9]